MPNDPYKGRCAAYGHRLPAVRDPFLNCSKTVRALITVSAIILIAHTINGQSRLGKLENIIHENAAFDEADFAQLHRGEVVVTTLPSRHKQEVSVYGVVRVEAPAEVFLQSFRDTIGIKNSPAILEIGRFSMVPTAEDLKTLTMETRDIEDLKSCVVGNCELKLSAKMIAQFKESVDWHASDYAAQTTRAYKSMLLDYVKDYLNRGDQALIEYTDKSTTASLLEGQRALLGSLPTAFREIPETGNSLSRQSVVPVENTIVWSKIKFGLKPVLAINHIVIFKIEQESGPQILVLSKQIYANHYFDASIGLTGLARNPASDHDQYYLFYENHSLVDGLQGILSGIKRRLIEREAVEGLKTILQGTKIRLDARAVNAIESGRAPEGSSSWIGLKVPRKQLLFLIICITALVMLAFASYQRRANLPPRTHAS